MNLLPNARVLNLMLRCCICSLVLYLGVLKHVDALGQISSNKSAAQGLIAQTDNALIQYAVCLGLAAAVGSGV